MARTPPAPRPLALATARRLWLRAQRLDTPEPFGAGPAATTAAVEHLGYVQIDTINVIERSHHHILWSRIPRYRRDDLRQALSVERTLFEYWAHALAYIPIRDYRFFLPAMRSTAAAPGRWFASVAPADRRRLVARIRRDGPLSIRDIDEELLAEKDHAWASRKPSKRALELLFFTGVLTVSERSGMLKTYDLAERHFGWQRRPRPATEAQVTEYLLDRALRSQAVVSLDSICHLNAPAKPAVAALIEKRVAARRLVPVTLEGGERVPHWLASDAEAGEGELAHILSPFDPLVIQRKRLRLFFGHDHRFEAYVPKAKRVHGYFALPVLIGDRIVAVVDTKADRTRRALAVQQLTWLDAARPEDRPRLDEALGRFETFQFGS